MFYIYIKNLLAIKFHKIFKFLVFPQISFLHQRTQNKLLLI